jgi:hypothetical protein
VGYASGLGASLGVSVEATAGTESTGSMGFYEILDHSLQLVPTYLDSAGLKTGQGHKRGARTQISRYDVNGDIQLEFFDRGTTAASGKGMGFWLKQMLGQVNVTQVTGSAYRQIAVPAARTGLSFTTQVGMPQVDASGTVVPMTFRGCKITQWEFSCSDGQLAQLKLTIDGWTMTTGTSLVSPTFAGSGYQAGIFSFVDVAPGNFTIGGTASTTAGATGETSIAGGATVGTVVKNFTLSGTTPLAQARYGFGNAGVKREQYENGIPTITGTLEAEWTSRAEFFDPFVNNTSLPMQIKWTHYLNGLDANGVGGGTGANPYLLSFILPQIKIKTDPVKLNGPDLLSQTIGFEAYDDGSNPVVQCKIVSQDQAI